MVDMSINAAKKNSTAIAVLMLFVTIAIIIVVTIVYWETESRHARIGLGAVVLVMQLLQFGIFLAYGHSKKKQFEIGQVAIKENTIYNDAISKLDAHKIVEISRLMEENKEKQRKIEQNTVMGFRDKRNAMEQLEQEYKNLQQKQLEASGTK